MSIKITYSVFPYCWYSGFRRYLRKMSTREVRPKKIKGWQRWQTNINQTNEYSSINNGCGSDLFTWHNILLSSSTMKTQSWWIFSWKLRISIQQKLNAPNCNESKNTSINCYDDRRTVNLPIRQHNRCTAKLIMDMLAFCQHQNYSNLLPSIEKYCDASVVIYTKRKLL